MLFVCSYFLFLIVNNKVELSRYLPAAISQCWFLTRNLIFRVENLPFARVRESHMAGSFLYKVKKMFPFPIFAVLFVSSIGAYKMASNKKGGMLTYKNTICTNIYYFKLTLTYSKLLTELIGFLSTVEVYRSLEKVLPSP